MLKRVIFSFTSKSTVLNSFSASMVSSADFCANPVNEPIWDYRPGSDERKALEASIAKYEKTVTDIPIIIGDEEIRTSVALDQVKPHDHHFKIAKYYYADKALIQRAIQNCLSAREEWAARSLKERTDVLFKAADLIADKYRMDVNATTILGQSKTIIQAEIDAACELIDFLRFNSHFALQLENYQPISSKGVTNTMTYRGLEGFVAAVSPFNFTAIGGNLAGAPAAMGNVVVWKPSDTCMLSNYVVYKALREAGIPPGVINFVPSDGPVFGDTITSSPDLAAINFTGSVPTFKKLWKMVAHNLDNYKTFPRLVGECGGKNFHFVHPSAETETVAVTTVRSAFEYQGQKCSACGRMYVAESLWPQIKDKMLAVRDQLKMGPAEDGSSFVSAVIDDKSFSRIKSYIDEAKKGGDASVLAGGKCDDSKGYFVEPTIVQVKNPASKLMTEEIFGPVLSVYVYPDADADKVLGSLKDATPYGLTGAIYAQDKAFVGNAKKVLRDAVGNFYINDKSTGSVVGQQPFGGARLSGTNDKAGGPHYMLRWASPLTTKESHTPLHEWTYPYMGN